MFKQINQRLSPSAYPDINVVVQNVEQRAGVDVDAEC